MSPDILFKMSGFDPIPASQEPQCLDMPECLTV